MKDSSGKHKGMSRAGAGHRVRLCAGPDLVNTNGRIMNHSSEPGSENQKTLNKGTLRLLTIGEGGKNKTALQQP